MTTLETTKLTADNSNVSLNTSSTKSQTRCNEMDKQIAQLVSQQYSLKQKMADPTVKQDKTQLATFGSQMDSVNRDLSFAINSKFYECNSFNALNGNGYAVA